jgi:hypothetical protein
MPVSNDYRKWIWYRKNVNRRYYYFSRRIFLNFRRERIIKRQIYCQTEKKTDTWLAINIQWMCSSLKRQYNVASLEKARQEDQVDRYRYTKC